MPTVPQRFVVAPDKFKGSLTAAQVARSMSEAVQLHVPTAQVQCLPMADGGDGTLETMMSAGFGVRHTDAAGPMGVLRPAQFGWRELEGRKQAFVELATVCGIALLGNAERDPYVASSLGVGQVLKEAMRLGADELVVALGGSASVDGGLGLLMGLGFRVLDQAGRPVEPNLRGLLRARQIVIDDVDYRNVACTVLVDVSNPLCGSQGAAQVFGPQKGLHEAELEYVDAALNDWGRLVERTFGVTVIDLPGTGAAGGIPVALLAAFDAELASGAGWVANQQRLEQAIVAGDVVITGEGAFDSQSLMGKAPGLVVDLAQRHGKPVVVIAGSVDRRVAEEHNLVAVSTSDIAGSVARSFVHADAWVTKATSQALNTLFDRSGVERKRA